MTRGWGIAIAVVLAACGGQRDEVPLRSERRAEPIEQPARSFAVPTAVAPGSELAANDELALLKTQVAMLRGEVGEMRLQLAHMPAGVRNADAGPDPRRDAGARLEAEQADRMRNAAAEAAFRSESNDARWSQGAVASVRAALADAQEPVRNQVRSIECRSRTCRLEVAGDPGGPSMSDLPGLLSQLAQTLPHVAAGKIDPGDGSQTTVLYLSR